MTPETVNALINLGVLGPVVAVLFLVVLRLHSQLRESQDKRTADAKAVVDRILTLVDQQHRVDQELNATLIGIQATLVDVRETLREGRGGRR